MERPNKTEFLDLKITTFNTDCSPSHLFNNLTSSDKSLMFIHNSEAQPRIITVDYKLFADENNIEKVSTYVTKFNSNETNEMLVLKCLFLNNVYYVAVGLYGGFKLWSIDGNRLLFQIPAKVKETDKPYAFTAVWEFVSQEGKPADAILCGDNYGQLYLVVGYGQIWKSKLIYTNEGLAITSMTSKNEITCVAYENGEIHLLQIKGDAMAGDPIKIINNLKLPCLSMAVISYPRKGSPDTNILVSSFLNGEVKLFDISNGNLLSSLASHVRMINTLQIYREYFITLADDCQCNIFKISSEEGDIQLAGSVEIPDRMPVGLVVVPKQLDFDMIVANYDSTELIYITVSKN
jgi:hypothetical protein